ncbi:diacylglycerol kinase family protein [Marinobacterium maritimum]|uniref:Diacylglycerol kinase family protein n=1 Tax=Marinobacterium maritimum TaxID=500162 RepID=A0ABP3TEG6_9GAMM
MMSDSGRRFLVCINTTAGDQADAVLEQQIRQRIPEEQLQALLRLTPKRALVSQLKQLVQRCVETGAVLVVAGGDGTLNAAVSALAGSGVALGVIPCGTFNFFARDRGIPIDHQAAIDVLLHGRERSCSLASINGIPFSVSASIGVYPRIIAAREQVSAVTGRNRLVSLLSGIWVFLTRARGRRLCLEHDGEHQVETAPMLLASVSPSQLENFELAEIEGIERGQMLVFVMQSDAPLALCRYLWASLKGELKRLEQLDYFLTEWLQVSTRRSHLTVAVDGELHRCRSPLVLETRQDAYRCLVPGGASPCA